MSGAEAWRQAQNVLCVRLDTLGDVLMTTPALSALKQTCPGRRITLLTSTPGAAIARLVPQIDEVLVYDAPWMKASSPRADSCAEYQMIERLRGASFDAAIIFTVYSQNPLPTAMLCYLADIPLRLAHCRENPYQLLTDWVPDPEPSRCVRHEVRRQLDLVAAIGCRTSDERLSVQTTEEARLRVRGLLGQLGVDLRQPWIVLHPGATAPSRRYPAEAFAEVARQLVVDDGMQVLFTGTATERQLVERIQVAMGIASYHVVDWLKLDELIALIQLAPLLVTNNTGPAHIAAAVGTPVVDLYALTNPQHTPWQVPQRVLFHDVPCKYCYKSVCPEGHHNCLRRVEPAAVVQAVRSLLTEVGADATRRGSDAGCCLSRSARSAQEAEV